MTNTNALIRWPLRSVAGVMLYLALTLPATAQPRLPDPGNPFVELKPIDPPVLASPGASPGGQQAVEPIKAALAAERFTDAIALADAQLTRLPVDAAKVRAAARSNLATAHLHAGELAAAARHYRAVLDELDEQGYGDRGTQQIIALHGLGVAEYGLGLFGPAAGHLEQAVFLYRANLGLNSPEQIAPGRGLAETYLALGRYDAAAARAQANAAIAQQAYGPASDQALQATQTAADFLGRLGRFHEQRTLLRRQLDLIREEHGYRDWRLVEPLRALALSYQQAFVPEQYGLSDLELAIEIQDAQPERFDVVERARTRIALGDYYLTFGNGPRASQLYDRAWNLLAEAGESSALEQFFARSAPLFVPQPEPDDEVGEFPAAGLPAGRVRFRFDINPQGRVVAPEVIELDPPKANGMRIRAARAMRSARFRPTVTASGPIFTRDAEHEIRFRYAPDEPAAGENTAVPEQSP